MNKFVEVVMVHMGKDSEHLPHNVLTVLDEVWRERSACFRRKYRLIVDLVGYPRQHILDILTCWQVDSLSTSIFPEIIGVGPCAHGWVLFRRHVLGDDTIEQIQMAIHLKDIKRKPLAIIHVFRQLNNRFERSFDQCRLYERLRQK